VIIASGLKAAWFAFVIMSIGLTEAENLTRLLVAWGKGERSAFDELAPAIYGELRRIAACHMRRERSGSLQPTALVHEAYIRLLPQRGVPWQNRAHFYAIASQMMRRVLLDRARARVAAKRGAAAVNVSISVAERMVPARDVEMIELDAALKDLEAMDPRMGRVVELRFFGGLTSEEIAEVMGISRATVEREWSSARAWLRRELDKSLPRP
jgi:RNA polymerase sigma factor (TIGR02999 family)